MKRIISLLAAAFTLITLAACAEKVKPVKSSGAVWQYTYAGVEHHYLDAVCAYLAEYDADHLELADGMIPCITSIDIDNDDQKNIRFFGIFDIYNYALSEKTLVEKSAKRLVGLFELEQLDGGKCSVKNASLVDENDAAAIEKLCGGREMALEGLKNPVVSEESRRLYVSQFVKKNGIDAEKYKKANGEEIAITYQKKASPSWVAQLPEAAETDCLIVVDITSGTNAVLTMHEKNADGTWNQTLDDAAFIGKNGPGKTREGDTKTPLGTFGFNAALGINDDPGCAIPYIKVNDTHYWVADSNSAHYNKLVSTDEYTDFDVEEAERIMDYPNAYKYLLNTTYNEQCAPGVGSAIFLHCYREQRTYTGGCISIPFESMEYVMKHISPDAKIIIRMQPDGISY
ncbi:MAG: hypothetical protein IKI64_02680 [Clostridia bacterium]|nr:hypothetical protein [Clostridia bacterium]